MPSEIRKRNMRERFHKYNELIKSVQNEGFDNIPKIMSEKDIDDFVERMSDEDMDRYVRAFYKAFKHDAGEMAITNGETMPMFMRVMIDELINYTNYQRGEIRAAFPDSIDDPIWIGIRTSGRNLKDIKGQYYTAEDLEDLFDVSISEYSNLVEMYVAVMVENHFTDEAINYLLDIYQKDPVRFRTIMESNSDEVELNYIYVSADMTGNQFIMTSSGVHKVGVSADQTSFDNRQNNVERFWTLRHLEYENGVAPFTYGR